MQPEELVQALNRLSLYVIVLAVVSGFALLAFVAALLWMYRVVRDWDGCWDTQRAQWETQRAQWETQQAQWETQRALVVWLNDARLGYRIDYAALTFGVEGLGRQFQSQLKKVEDTIRHVGVNGPQSMRPENLTAAKEWHHGAAAAAAASEDVGATERPGGDRL